MVEDTKIKEKAIKYINEKITVLKACIEEVEPIIEFQKLTGDLPPELGVEKRKSYKHITPKAVIITLKRDLVDWETKLKKIELNKLC